MVRCGNAVCPPIPAALARANLPELCVAERTPKQYCRYCCYLCTGNGIWCDKQGREIKESTAKSPNRCHDFALNPIDAFGENEKGYQPRKPKKKQCDGQMNLFQGIGN